MKGYQGSLDHSKKSECVLEEDKSYGLRDKRCSHLEDDWFVCFSFCHVLIITKRK